MKKIEAPSTRIDEALTSVERKYAALAGMRLPPMIRTEIEEILLEQVIDAERLIAEAEAANTATNPLAGAANPAA